MGKTRRPADPNLVAAADVLRRVALTIDQGRRHYGEVSGVRSTDLLALANLVADGPLTSGELSRRLGITPSSVTTLVDRLEAARLVVRHDDPADRRRRSVVLTARGEDESNRARSWALEALQTIEPSHLPAVLEALREVAAALEQHENRAS